MQELLSGVKLRKVEPPPQSVPSLSCHEVLMRQIKARKVVLKPPVLPAEGERERSAREEIMDFIKSRPRLRPVVERSQLRTLARSQKMTLSFEDTSTEQHSYAGQHTQSPLHCHALCIAIMPSNMQLGSWHIVVWNTP